MGKKLSTKEILAKARAEAKQEQSTEAETGAETAETEAAAPETEAAAEPASETSESSPKPTPKSTKDILAAARAQAKGAAAQAETPQTASAAASSKSPAAPKSKPQSTPKSTKDILAAARAQAKGDAPAKSQPTAKAKSAKPAGKAAAAKASPAATAGETPSVKEMLEAVRGKKEATATAAAPAKPKLPARPPKAATPAKGKKEAGVKRRSVLKSVFNSFAVAWIALGTASVAFGLGVARFMMPNVLVEPPTKFKVGPPSDYPPGQVSTKWKAARGIWIVNTDQYNGKPMIYALLSVCTHLGCTPNWLEGEQKFKCPCHGSGFYINGINFEGPAPRPLERVGIRLADDGMLEVDKSVKFQQELGQWEEPTSFYPVA